VNCDEADYIEAEFAEELADLREKADRRQIEPREEPK
jgi:hypothetical protein